MSRMTRRTLMHGALVAGSAGAAATAAAARLDVYTRVPGQVVSFNQTRALLVFEADAAEKPRLLIELRGDTPLQHATFRPLQRVSLILSPPRNPGALSPWDVQAVISDRGEHLPFDARVLSVTWAGRDQTDDILQIVSAHFGVSVAEILSDGRARQVARPRQIAMYLMSRLTPHSFAEIGLRVGNRDYTTVSYGIRKIEREMTRDIGLRGEIEGLQRQVIALQKNGYQAA